MSAASAAFEPLTIETRPSDEASVGQKYDGSRTSEPIAKSTCSVPGRDRVDVELVAGGILHEHELDVVSPDAHALAAAEDRRDLAERARCGRRRESLAQHRPSGRVRRSGIDGVVRSARRQADRDGCPAIVEHRLGAVHRGDANARAGASRSGDVSV